MEFIASSFLYTYTHRVQKTASKMGQKHKCRETGMQENELKTNLFMKILFMDNLSLSPALLSGQCNFLDFTRDILVSASVSEHQMVSCISQLWWA